MNTFVESTSTGFLIGIYFLASAMVALTLVYFSRPRPKSQAVKNTTESGKTVDSKAEIQTKLPVNHTGAGIKRLFRAKDRSSKQPDQLIEKKSDAQVPVTSEKKAEEPKESVSKTDKNNSKEQSSPQNSEIQIQHLNSTRPASEDPETNKKSENGESLNQTKPENVPVAQPESITSQTPVQEKSIVKNNAAPITTTDASITQVSTNFSPSLMNSKTVPDPVNSVEPVREGLPATTAGSESSSPDTTDNKGDDQEMEDDLKTTSSTDDFSDLFTEDDTEESDVTRLGKELNDVETEDILVNTRDLITHFKRSNN